MLRCMSNKISANDRPQTYVYHVCVPVWLEPIQNEFIIHDSNIEMRLSSCCADDGPLRELVILF